MDKDRIAGASAEPKRALKEAAGTITDGEKLQVQGKVDKAVGHAQNTVSQAKDAVRNAAK